VDDRTSAAWFSGWRRPLRDMRLRPAGEVPVGLAQSWMLREGWQRAGGRIETWETPAAGRPRSAAAKART